MTQIGNITFNEGKTEVSFSIKNVSEGSGTYVIWVYDSNPNRPIIIPQLSPGTLMHTVSNMAAMINVRPNGVDAGSMHGQAQGSSLDDVIANSQRDMYGNCVPPYITNISPSSITINDVTSEEPKITLTGKFNCVPFGNLCEDIELNVSIQKVQERGNENIDCKTFAYIDITVKDSCVNDLEKFKLSGLTIKDKSDNIVDKCVTGQTYTGEALITNDNDDITISDVILKDSTGTQVTSVSGSKIGGGLFDGPRRLTFTFTPSCVFPSNNKQLSFNIHVRISCNDGGTLQTKDIACGSILIIAPVNCSDIEFTSYVEKPVLNRSSGASDCSSTYFVSCTNSPHIINVYIIKEVGGSKIYASSVEQFIDGVKFVFACLPNQYPEGEYYVYFETDIGTECTPGFGTITVSGSSGYCMVIESLHAELLPDSMSVSFTPKIPTGFTENSSCETQSIRIDAFGDTSRQNAGYLTDPIGTLSLDIIAGTPVSTNIPITNMGGYDCSSVISIVVMTTGQSAATCCNYDGVHTKAIYNGKHSKSKIITRCVTGSSLQFSDNNYTITFTTPIDYIPSSYTAKIYGTDPLSTFSVDVSITPKEVPTLLGGKELKWTAYLNDVIKTLQTEKDARIAFACLDTSTGKGECLYCSSSDSKIIIVKQLGYVRDLWP